MKINFSNLKRNKGFTLAELITASVISVTVLIAGFSLVNNILGGNKSDETNLALSDKIDNALDFFVNELNSGKRVLTNIDQYPSHCVLPAGEFVLGISFPLQSINEESYLYQLNDSNSWKEIECPITYSIKIYSKQKEGRISYSLIRKGPQIDRKGYYLVDKISDSNILNNISSKPTENIICSESSGWSRREIKGIVICTDKFRRGAEISISVEKIKSFNKYISITRTSGGFTRIADNSFQTKNSNCKRVNEAKIKIPQNEDGYPIGGGYYMGGREINRIKIQPVTIFIGNESFLVKDVSTTTYRLPSWIWRGAVNTNRWLEDFAAKMVLVINQSNGNYSAEVDPNDKTSVKVYSSQSINKENIQFQANTSVGGNNINSIYSGTDPYVFPGNPQVSDLRFALKCD